MNAIKEICTSSKDPECRAHAVSIIGTYAQSVGVSPHIGVIAQVLIKSLEDPSLLVVAEALNAIFDTFADAHDDIYKAGRMQDVLKAYVPIIKVKVRGDGATLEKDVLVRVKEALLNLQRFLDYKKSMV